MSWLKLFASMIGLEYLKNVNWMLREEEIMNFNEMDIGTNGLWLVITLWVIVIFLLGMFFGKYVF